LCDIDLFSHDRAMQAFIKQEIGTFRQRTPFGKSARFCAVQLGLVIIVDVMTGGSGAGFAVVAKHPLQFLEQIGFGLKWLKCLLPRSPSSAIFVRISTRL